MPGTRKVRKTPELYHGHAAPTSSLGENKAAGGYFCIVDAPFTAIQRELLTD